MSTKLIEIPTKEGEEKRFTVYKLKEAKLEDGTIVSVLNEEENYEITEAILLREKSQLEARIVAINELLTNFK